MINRSIQRLASVNDRSTVTWRATATDDIETQCSEWQQCTFAAVVASMRRTMSVCVQFVHCQTVGLIKLHWVYFAWHFFACCILLLLASFIAPSFHDCCALVLLRIHISFEELDMAPIASYLHMLLHVACTSNRMAKATSQVKNMLNMTFVESTYNSATESDVKPAMLQLARHVAETKTTTMVWQNRVMSFPFLINVRHAVASDVAVRVCWIVAWLVCQSTWLIDRYKHLSVNKSSS